MTVPDSQKLACLKYILKKEILSWNDEDASNTEKGFNAVKNGENDGNGDNGDNSDNDTMNNKEEKNRFQIEIEEKEKKIQLDNLKYDEKTGKKLSPFKKLLSRKPKEAPVEKNIENDDNEENKNKKIEMESAMIINAPTKIEKSVSNSEENSVEITEKFPSHFSPFPSAVSADSVRTFQAVIFADDESQGKIVCDSVRALLSQDGKILLFFRFFFFF